MSRFRHALAVRTSSSPRKVAPTKAGDELLRAIAPIDELLMGLARHARVLPAAVAKNGASERARLIAAVARGDAPRPHWELTRKVVDRMLFRAVDEARALCVDRLPRVLAGSYIARLDELELDLAILGSIGEAARVRPLVARRYGTGLSTVELPDGRVRLSDVSRQILSTIPDAEEERTVSAETVAKMLASAADAIGLRGFEVRIDPRLVAGAATGDRAIFVGARTFGMTESVRLIAHEVFGHAVAAANATRHPIRLYEAGSAGSFADQEGLCLCLEEDAGALDAHRLRILAARVLMTDRMHSGASFGESARHLVRDYGFSAESAVTLAERAYRGGGVARDAAYLYGYLRVRRALREGGADIDAMRIGRVGLVDLRTIEELRGLDLISDALLTPEWSEVAASTGLGD